MDVSTALLAHLHDLARSLGAGLPGTDDVPDRGSPLGESLRNLMVGAGSAIASYSGLRLTVTQNDFPVVLTALPVGPDGVDAAGTPTASLRLPLPLLDAGFEPGSRIVFYARTSGALVDLAADLAHAVGDSPTEPGIVLDADLPGGSRSGLTGMAELSTINRAAGKMIDAGVNPRAVYALLRHRAAADGLAAHDWARRHLHS